MLTVIRLGIRGFKVKELCISSFREMKEFAKYPILLAASRLERNVHMKGRYSHLK